MGRRQEIQPAGAARPGRTGARPLTGWARPLPASRQRSKALGAGVCGIIFTFQSQLSELITKSSKFGLKQAEMALEWT